jgi:hypothetical protein
MVAIRAGLPTARGSTVTVDPVGEDPGLAGPLRRDDADLVFAAGVDRAAALGPAEPHRVGRRREKQAAGEPQVRAASAPVVQGGEAGEPEGDFPVGGEPGCRADPQPGSPRHPPDLLAGEHGAADEQDEACEGGGQG